MRGTHIIQVPRQPRIFIQNFLLQRREGLRAGRRRRAAFRRGACCEAGCGHGVLPSSSSCFSLLTLSDLWSCGLEALASSNSRLMRVSVANYACIGGRPVGAVCLRMRGPKADGSRRWFVASLQLSACSVRNPAKAQRVRESRDPCRASPRVRPADVVAVGGQASVGMAAQCFVVWWWICQAGMYIVDCFLGHRRSCRAGQAAQHTARR